MFEGRMLSGICSIGSESTEHLVYCSALGKARSEWSHTRWRKGIYSIRTHSARKLLIANFYQLGMNWAFIQRKNCHLWRCLRPVFVLGPLYWPLWLINTRNRPLKSFARWYNMRHCQFNLWLKNWKASCPRTSCSFWRHLQKQFNIAFISFTKDSCKMRYKKIK